MRVLNRISLLSVLLFLSGGCGERWLSNPAGSRAFRFKNSHDGIVGLQVKSMERGDVTGFVDTGASKYHRYSARWINDDCILFKSADVGCRAILANGTCRSFFATAESKDGILRVALFDEQWNPVGIEFECREEKPAGR